jgi:hypothetical protein
MMSTTTTTYEMLNSSLPIISNGTNGLENSTSIPFYQMNNGANPNMLNGSVILLLKTYSTQVLLRNILYNVSFNVCIHYQF